MAVSFVSVVVEVPIAISTRAAVVVAVPSEATVATERERAVGGRSNAMGTNNWHSSSSRARASSRTTNIA